MREFLGVVKVVSFGCMLLGVFAAASNLVPQAQGYPPVIRDLRYVNTVEKMIDLGSEIFGSEEEPGRGTCPMCHRRIGGRAPVMDGVSFRALNRIASPTYNGQATTMEEYVRESEQCPSCFVVPGYGQKGSHDKTSPMEVTVNPPTGLTPIEVDSVIAFFQDRDGHEQTAVPITDPDTDLRWDYDNALKNGFLPYKATAAKAGMKPRPDELTR